MATSAFSSDIKSKIENHIFISVSNNRETSSFPIQKMLLNIAYLRHRVLIKFPNRRLGSVSEVAESVTLLFAEK